jgi:hypothetical protein
MTDWTQSLQASPTHLHTYSRFAALGRGRAGPNTAAPATTTWVNGLGIYIPFRIPFAYEVERMFWINGSTITSTSVDAAVYSIDGTLICSTTPTAMVGASTLQYQAPTTVVLLSPGRYYLAWTCNNTTSRANATALATLEGQVMGIQQQSSVATLPNSMTPVAYAGQGVPFVGITRTASGF